jgi:murein L,D-transpeptidase YafK
MTPPLSPKVSCPSASKNKSKDKKRLLALSLFVGSGAALYVGLVRLNFVAPISHLPAVLCIPDCQAQPPIHPTITRPSDLSNQPPLQNLLGRNYETEKVSILVEKSKYKLTVFYNNQPVKSYPIVLGSAPVGDKRAEGDRKTPEGIYRVRDRYPHPQWSKFIWLDYPTQQDWQEHSQAKLAGEIAPDATIGSEVGIHGVPNGLDDAIDRRSNWTWGCISLKNKDINEIYEVVTQGTLIEIIP